MDSVTIKTTDKDGKDIELVVKPASHQVMQKAQAVYSSKIAELLREVATGKSALLPRCQLEGFLEKLGVFTMQDKVEMSSCQLEIRACEVVLKKGGVKLAEGKEVAQRMKQLRANLMLLFQKKSEYQSSTLESVAEQEKFIFIVVRTVYVKGTDAPFFADIEDYRSRETEQSSRDAAAQVAAMYFGYSEKDVGKLPENKWLRQYKFADDQNRPIDSKGRLIDITGRLINADGRYIGEDGKLCDYHGESVDEEGNLVVQNSEPFTDDAGQPVVPAIETA